jgi:hypothetical protein
VNVNFQAYAIQRHGWTTVWALAVSAINRRSIAKTRENLNQGINEIIIKIIIKELPH